MSSPAVGARVIYHSTNGYDVPGFVVENQDTWTAAKTDAWNFRDGGTAQPPGDGQAFLVVFDVAMADVHITGPTSEGNSAGQFSYSPTW